MRQIIFLVWFGMIGIVWLISACSALSPSASVIVVTATSGGLPVVVLPYGSGATVLSTASLSPSIPLATPLPALEVPLSQPTLDPAHPTQARTIPESHTVQSGETLSGIAARYGLSLNSVLAANTLTNPNLLVVGQVIQLPDAPSGQTPVFKIVPDSRLVRAPGSRNFDLVAFINQQPGFIRTATDTVTTRLANGTAMTQLLSAAQVVERVSLEFSVDARLLLALLEYRAAWLSDPTPIDSMQTHPLISEENSIGVDRSGLYQQLSWTANQLNRGYYGWKYRGQRVLEFVDGLRLNYGAGLNAGTVGVQYMLSLNTSFSVWREDVQLNGLYRVYVTYFGDPFANAYDPIVPAGLAQPDWVLPFQEGDEWRYTGGAHGGWGSGSGWSAVDFAPPDESPPGGGACYTSTTLVTAVADGVVARGADGVAVLDLDFDGDESTGWTLIYLHMSDLPHLGMTLTAGSPMGRASCAGGFSTATHLHLARRYNGEWIPVDCEACLPHHQPPPFVMSGWRASGLSGQEYQGFMTRATTVIQALQGRQDTNNRVSR